MEAGWRKEYTRYRGFFLNIAQVTQKRQDVKLFLEIALTISTIVIFTIFALKPTMVTIAEVVKEIKHKDIGDYRLRLHKGVGFNSGYETTCLTGKSYTVRQVAFARRTSLRAAEKAFAEFEKKALVEKAADNKRAAEQLLTKPLSSRKWWQFWKAVK